MGERILRVKPLTPAAFGPFGEVIETAGHEAVWINERTSQRYNDLARVDVQEAGGTPLISIFRALPRPMPLAVQRLERHPLSSQAFYPLERRPFLVIVAEAGSEPLAERLQAFLASGFQGVNYRRNTWHHSLIALEQPCDFLVVDRGGPEANCEEQAVLGDRVLVKLS
jgi:ureidoglycolate lyase